MEGKDAIRLLRFSPSERLDKLARKISHVKDAVEKHWLAEEKLNWCVKLLEEEGLELKRLMNVNVEVEEVET